MKLPFEKTREELIKVGRLAFSLNLTDSHGGNISARKGNWILIKKRGCMLGSLKKSDFVLTTIEPNEFLDRHASVELKVHRSIYQKVKHANAVIHLHSPFTVAMSLKKEVIVPEDSEGKFLLGEVPVLSFSQTISSDEVAKTLPEYFSKGVKVCVVKNHGLFAVGETVEESLKYASCLENSCRIMFFAG